jgi:glycosyltransferase involved in cell wall biosynthesis
MPHKPALSIIIASFNSAATIGQCLASLRDQAASAPFEVIVIDTSTDGSAEIVEKAAAQWRSPPPASPLAGPRTLRLLYFPQRKFCGDARNTGIATAQADLIAFIDADCTADPDWVDAILRAHASPDLAIGGPIANAQPASIVAWASYFCEFSQWMPGSPAAQLNDIAAANMSYKRQVFAEFGAFIEGAYSSDTEFHWRLAQRGHRLRFVPSIRISHRSIDRLGQFLRHEIIHGRFFARVRAASRRFSPARRIAYAILSPLVPLILFARIAARNFTNRTYLRHFLAASPLLLLGLAAWAFGESLGYLARPEERVKPDQSSQEPSANS